MGRVKWDEMGPNQKSGTETKLSSTGRKIRHTKWNSRYIIIHLIITFAGANNIGQDIYPLKLTPHQTSCVSSY